MENYFCHFCHDCMIKLGHKRKPISTTGVRKLCKCCGKEKVIVPLRVWILKNEK